MGIRVVVVDDNPHVRWEGRVYPVNATFHRFLSAVLDVPGQNGSPAIAEIVHCVPLREATEPPGTLPLDQRLRVVGTAPFDGIAGYLRHLPGLTRANRPILRGAIGAADLVWIKVPASNAILAVAVARRAGVPRFTYVAGRARDVARAQARRGWGRLAAVIVGAIYDGIGRVAAAGGDRVVVGERLGSGGIVTSLVAPDEIRAVDGLPWPAEPGRLRLAWAGRVADGKGLPELLEAVAGMKAPTAGDPMASEVTLRMIGDGPARAALERLAADLGVAGSIEWSGYIAERTAYLAAFSDLDLFVFPSPAEGFPKVVLDAMALGLPVVARPSGFLRELAELDLIESIGPGTPGAGPSTSSDASAAIVKAIGGLVADAPRARRLRGAGTAFAQDHTAAAEASRLVAHWRLRFPALF